MAAAPHKILSLEEERDRFVKVLQPAGTTFKASTIGDMYKEMFGRKFVPQDVNFGKLGQIFDHFPDYFIVERLPHMVVTLRQHETLSLEEERDRFVRALQPAKTFLNSSVASERYKEMFGRAFIPQDVGLTKLGQIFDHFPDYFIVERLPHMMVTLRRDDPKDPQAPHVKHAANHHHESPRPLLARIRKLVRSGANLDDAHAISLASGGNPSLEALGLILLQAISQQVSPDSTSEANITIVLPALPTPAASAAPAVPAAPLAAPAAPAAASAAPAPAALAAAKIAVSLAALTVHNAPKVRATFAYEAQKSDELTFAKGDIISNVDKNGNPTWWLGTVAGGRRGVFPFNYVEELP